MPTKPLQQKVTKPTQAGSSRSLDRWQREVQKCIGILATDKCPDGIGTCIVLSKSRVVHTLLTRLLASLRKAERR